MTKRITGIVQTIVLVLALAGTTIAGDRYNDLEPEEGIYSLIEPDPYDLVLRDLLLNEHTWRLCQVLVVPSFSPEWAVYLTRDNPTKGEAQVIYKVMKSHLWQEMYEVIEKNGTNDLNTAYAKALAQLKKPVNKAAAPISESTTALLEKIWIEMLMRVHYEPLEEFIGEDGETYIEVGLDGVTYHVSHPIIGMVRSGTTWSPEAGSNTGALVEIAEDLRQYATADSKKRPQIEATIVQKAKNLLAKLKKEHEKDTLSK